jgi:hypothetical protein
MPCTTHNVRAAAWRWCRRKRCAARTCGDHVVGVVGFDEGGSLAQELVDEPPHQLAAPDGHAHVAKLAGRVQLGLKAVRCVRLVHLYGWERGGACAAGVRLCVQQGRASGQRVGPRPASRCAFIPIAAMQASPCWAWQQGPSFLVSLHGGSAQNCESKGRIAIRRGPTGTSHAGQGACSPAPTQV